MKKLDLYIIRKFLGTFFFSLVLILCIVVVFDLSEKLEKFLENEAPVKAIVFDYYKNFIPYFANVFSSLFTFISVIFFTSKTTYRYKYPELSDDVYSVPYWHIFYPYIAFRIQSVSHWHWG